MKGIDIIQSKIVGVNQYDQLNELVSNWRFLKKKVVFTNGCFDLVHLGHIDYLVKASDLGDLLIIGLNTDNSVQRLKGPSRPINSQNARAMLLASMFFVSKVVLFDADTPLKLIEMIKPNVLVKGSDYKPEMIVGHDVVKSNHGEVVTIDFLPGFSTTGILEKIRQQE